MTEPHMAQPRSSLVLRGPCWTFGDNVPTDEMAEFFHRDKSAVLAGLNPRFAAEVRPGDIIVGGVHFGQSSGRSLAAKALQSTGVVCLAVESAARTFLRNCYELGLPVLECPGVATLVTERDEVEIDIERGVVTNLASGRAVHTAPPDPFLRDMLASGGLIPFVRNHPEMWRD